MNFQELFIFWRSLILAIGIQIVIISILCFFSKKRKEIILGFIAVLLTLCFNVNLFASSIDNAYHFIFIVLGSLMLFLGPLLYLYIDAFRLKTTNSWHILRASSFLFIGYIVLVVFDNLLPVDYSNYLKTFLKLSILYLISFYFWKGRNIIKNELSGIVKKNTLKRFVLFYVFINAVFIVEYFSQFVYMIDIFSNHGFILKQFNAFLVYARSVLWMPVYTLVQIYFFIYLVFQSKFIKDHFLSENIYYDKQLLNDNISIREKINAVLVKEKLYRNPDINLSHLSETFGIPKKIISEYIKENHNKNFKSFLNALRIKEFQEIITKSDIDNYTIFAVAEDVGFKSRTTFHRVFKAQLGITPKEYIQSLR